MIEYTSSKPTRSEYRHLFESAGWTSSIAISDDVLQTAIDRSWYWISVYDGERIVGIGRLVSDGALYAFVCDMIVLPDHRNQGIGSEILKRMKAKCTAHNIQRVWLFAAEGKTDFYLENGFDLRPEDAPGMQLKKN